MAADVSAVNAGGVAVQASSGSVWAIAAAAATTLAGIFLKFVIDINTRQSATLVASHAGETARLLAQIDQLDKKYSGLEDKFATQQQQLANLTARFDNVVADNAALQVKLHKRERQINDLSNKLHLEVQTRRGLEQEADQLRSEVNTLLQQNHQPPRYPTPT